MIYSMVRAPELPPVEPQWYPRQMTAKEVVEIASGREVPGVNLDHPVVEGIRLAGMGILTRDYFRDARVRGYLWLVSQRSDTGWHGPTEHIWGWWCAAAKHPEIVVTRRGEDCRLRVDLSSMQATWHLHALPELGRLIADGDPDHSLVHDRVVSMCPEEQTVTIRWLSVSVSPDRSST